MKTKILILILSLALAFMFLSGGYALWTKHLTIKGSITVAEPEAFASPQQPLLNNVNVSTQSTIQGTTNTTTGTLNLATGD